MSKSLKKQIKRNIKESMISDEGSAIENEGGVADHLLDEADTYALRTAKITEDMACLVIVLNVLFAPLGTFLAACLDKRGLNKALLIIGFIYLVPAIIVQSIAASMRQY